MIFYHRGQICPYFVFVLLLSLDVNRGIIFNVYALGDSTSEKIDNKSQPKGVVLHCRHQGNGDDEE